MNNILYLSYTGLLEPLGQSQVLGYLKYISKSYQVTLVTFEKAKDMQDKKNFTEITSLCEQYNIDWHPKIYHHKPRLLATFYDLCVMFISSWRCIKREKIKCIHCRSYIPAMTAFLINKLTGIPFIFDMRALWIDEMIDAKRLAPHSLLCKALRFFEKKLLINAYQIISLTKRSIPFLCQQYPSLYKEKFTVIPTCVDLSKIPKVNINNKKRLPKKVIGTIGTVTSGWFHLDWLGKAYHFTADEIKDIQCKIITRDNKNTVQKIMIDNGITNAEIYSVDPDAIFADIAQFTFAILFYSASIGKLGSSPTRMAEFLTCGVPVMVNRGVGDMVEIVEKYNVGVVVNDGSDDELKKGVKKMMALLLDPKLADRCFQLAKSHFSAEQGAKDYLQIYDRI